ncbi:MAG: hypothetical protein KF855_04750 [Acidobacteria bacterium]|nr:hypothetical protein [Acidobacteriota bacterium]
MGDARPPGLIESLHYGFAFRYENYRRVGDYGYGIFDWKQWHVPDENLEALDDDQLNEALPVMEKQAWAAGASFCLNLAAQLWPRLSVEAQGNFLGGAARHLSDITEVTDPGPKNVWGPNEKQEREMLRLADLVLSSLPSCRLNAQAAAEIAANSIKKDRLDILNIVMSHPDFDPDAGVERLHDDHRGFDEQISKHTTRTLDILLETAVRCANPEAAELLLKAGANPNIPCWNLERSSNEWYSLLSYAISSSRGDETIANLLLDHEADPRGLDCEGINKPLLLALKNDNWNLADRLLDMGADFSGGEDLIQERFERIPQLFGINADDQKWLQEKIAPLMHIAEPSEVPMFFWGHGQGGQYSTFLDSLTDDIDMLKHFESRGLSTKLTASIFVDFVKRGNFDVLLYLLRDEPNLARIIFRCRRRNPQIGTNRVQAWLSQPPERECSVVQEQQKEITEMTKEEKEARMKYLEKYLKYVFSRPDLEDFVPDDQGPLTLPDGSKFYVYMDAVATPDDFDEFKDGYFWLLEKKATYRRRKDRIIVRDLQGKWNMVEIPNDTKIETLMPLVKEVNGRFFQLGLTVSDLSRQIFPEEWKPLIDSWLGEPLERAKRSFRRRIEEQIANKD